VTDSLHETSAFRPATAITDDHADDFGVPQADPRPRARVIVADGLLDEQAKRVSRRVGKHVQRLSVVL
jgi:hypothetical protein